MIVTLMLTVGPMQDDHIWLQYVFWNYVYWEIYWKPSCPIVSSYIALFGANHNFNEAITAREALPTILAFVSGFEPVTEPNIPKHERSYVCVPLVNHILDYWWPPNVIMALFHSIVCVQTNWWALSNICDWVSVSCQHMLINPNKA